MSDVVRIPIRPPSWWRFACISFIASGALGVVIATSIVAVGFVSSAFAVTARDIISSAIIAAAGLLLVRNGIRSLGYAATEIVLGGETVTFPRLRTKQSITMPYADVQAFMWNRIPALRVRLFVRTVHGPFWVHRSWLTDAWTLRSVLEAMKKHRDASSARAAADGAAAAG